MLFGSNATNLVPSDTNGVGGQLPGYGADTFLRDRVEGTTRRVSVTAAGAEFGNQRRAVGATMDDSGRYITFEMTPEGGDSGDFSEQGDLWVHDRITGGTDLVNTTRSGARANDGGENPVLTGDGRSLVFRSVASDLVPGDVNEIEDVFRRLRGGPLELIALGARKFGATAILEGKATIAGVQLSAAADPDNDSASNSAEITGAEIIQRPEDGDLLFRIRATRLPSIEAPGSAATNPQPNVAPPGVLYGVRFTLNGDTWEIRASRAGTDQVNGAAPFGLYICRAVCTETQVLEGGYGTMGHEVTLRLTYNLLGLQSGETLGNVVAFAATGETATGGVEGGALDKVALPNVTLSEPSGQYAVTVGDADPVWKDAIVFNGNLLTATEKRPAAFAPGQKLWGRVCFAGACTQRTVVPVPVAAEPTPTATPTVEPTATPTPTVDPTPTATPTVDPTPTPVPTVVASPTPAADPTSTPTAEPAADPGSPGTPSQSAAAPLLGRTGYSVSTLVLRRRGSRARLSGRVLATAGCLPSTVTVLVKSPRATRYRPARRVQLRKTTWSVTLRAPKGSRFRVSTPPSPACATASSPAARL